jgi:hypothetical protein
MTLIQEYVNQVNYNGLATHPVIITAPFGIRFNPIQQHRQEFKQNILFNASIMHINPQCNILAIRAGHIVSTFISNTIEPVSPTQPDPDDNLNLLYLTPPPSPTLSSIDHHDGMNNGPGMLNDILSKQPDTINTTSPVVDDQFNYLYPKLLPSSLTDQPDYDVYYLTMHWPSDHQHSHYPYPTRPVLHKEDTNYRKDLRQDKIHARQNRTLYMPQPTDHTELNSAHELDQQGLNWSPSKGDIVKDYSTSNQHIINYQLNNKHNDVQDIT